MGAVGAATVVLAVTFVAGVGLAQTAAVGAGLEVLQQVVQADFPAAVQEAAAVLTAKAATAL